MELKFYVYIIYVKRKKHKRDDSRLIKRFLHIVVDDSDNFLNIRIGVFEENIIKGDFAVLADSVTNERMDKRLSNSRYVLKIEGN